MTVIVLVKVIGIVRVFVPEVTTEEVTGHSVVVKVVVLVTWVGTVTVVPPVPVL